MLSLRRAASILIALGGLAASCAQTSERYVEIPRPGLPAYWESSMPRDDRTPDASASPHDSSDAGGGTSDSFLWERTPPDLADAAPAAQVPVGGEPEKSEPNRDNVRGGDAGAVLRRSVDAL
jgi:hypothetical protein